MNIQFFFLFKFRHIYLTFLFSYKHDLILHCMCIGIRLNSTFFKRALCRISSLPFVERLPYTFLMSLDISIPLSDLFYFQRRSLCSPKKVFCAHHVLSMSLFSMELFLSENLVNGALENGTTVKGNDNECLTRHCMEYI